MQGEQLDLGHAAGGGVYAGGDVLIKQAACTADPKNLC